MSVITGDTTTSATAATSSTPAPAVVVGLITSPFDTIMVTILPQSFVGWLAAVIYRAGFTVAESWMKCKSHMVCFDHDPIDETILHICDP